MGDAAMNIADIDPIMYAELEDRATRGINLLDAESPVPNWRPLLDWDRMNMSDPFLCLIGQLAAHLTDEQVASVSLDGPYLNPRYNAFLSILGIPISNMSEEAPYGFDIKDGDDHEVYEQLQAVFAELILS